MEIDERDAQLAHDPEDAIPQPVVFAFPFPVEVPGFRGEGDEIELAAPSVRGDLRLLQDVPEEGDVFPDSLGILLSDVEAECLPQRPELEEARGSALRRGPVAPALILARDDAAQESIDAALLLEKALAVAGAEVFHQEGLLSLAMQIEGEVVSFRVDPQDDSRPQIHEELSEARQHQQRPVPQHAQIQSGRMSLAEPRHEVLPALDARALREGIAQRRDVDLFRRPDSLRVVESMLVAGIENVAAHLVAEDRLHLRNPPEGKNSLLLQPEALPGGKPGSDGLFSLGAKTRPH